LITVSSCSNYAGTLNNDASFLVLQKKLVISPKIIKPSTNASHWIQLADIPEGTNSSIRREPSPLRARQQ